MTDAIARQFGDDVSRKVTEIPNRVDLDTFSNVKVDYQIEDHPKIISVGRFSRIKNHIQLLLDLKATGKQFTLTLVGAGPLKGDYIKTAQDLGIEKSLIILENLTHAELSKQLATHDVYVHYSLTEGVPRAVLEAMCAGLPVISTNVGFIQGILESGENALLIETDSPHQFAAALDQLLGSADTRRRLGTAARDTVVARFEAGAVFAKYRAAVLGSRTEPKSNP